MYYLNNDYDTGIRYDMAKFLEFNSDNYDITTSYFIKAIKSLPMAGTKLVVAEASKPDLLSYNLYGSTQYWWILLLYNDMQLITDLTLGKVVRYPSVDTLEALYFQLASAQASGN